MKLVLQLHRTSHATDWASCFIHLNLYQSINHHRISWSSLSIKTNVV